MSDPKVVTHEEWLAARLELLEKEKELTRHRDAVNTARRELPMFDCFLVRSASNRASQLFAGADEAVQLVSRHGQWWAYAKRGPALAAR